MASGKVYDLILDFGSNVYRYCGVPVELDVDTLLAGAFPGVAVRHIDDGEDGEDQTLQ